MPFFVFLCILWKVKERRKAIIVEKVGETWQKRFREIQEEEEEEEEEVESK